MLKRIAPIAMLLMPALAAAQSPVFPQRRGADAWQPQLPPCECRAEGRRFAIGAEACLEFSGRRQVAICGMNQNTTSWIAAGRPCPES